MGFYKLKQASEPKSGIAVRVVMSGEYAPRPYLGNLIVLEIKINKLTGTRVLRESACVQRAHDHSFLSSVNGTVVAWICSYMSFEPYQQLQTRHKFSGLK
jgi:hypothetical protein